MVQADPVRTPNHAPNPDAQAKQSTTKPRQVRIKPADRRYFIGGSDARIIMGDDEAALLRLWREKRGEIEPEDLSGNLIVQLGLATEELNRRWYQANTGQLLTDIGRHIRHPVLRWMAATLDGRVAATEAVRGQVHAALGVLGRSCRREAHGAVATQHVGGRGQVSGALGHHRRG